MGETLTKFDGDLRLLREHLARQPTVKDDGLPRSWCLALIEIVDRLHPETLLARAGVTRFTALHQPFDPAAMAAVAVESSTQWPYRNAFTFFEYR